MEVITAKSSSQFSVESDEDLLEIISWKEEISERNSAFAEFHKRYKEFLYSIVSPICIRYPNSYELSSAIFNNVFINVYEYSGSFKYEGPKVATDVRKKIEGWLVTIAKTELKSLLSNYKVQGEDEQILYSKMLRASNVKPASISYNEEIVEKAFLLLKPREQDILRTYWTFYEKGEGSQAKNLPPEILEELAKHYETTSDNIRQIISRGNKKVREYLKTNYKLNINATRR